MIKKILIANRGEIALRIIKTCKKLDIQTICIASKAEINHPHLIQADQHEILDRESPSEVYLNQDLIIDTALKYQACAIHPGYGFLSENSEFAKKTINSGMKFIGPSPETLLLLGDKSKTRQLAIDLKVPVVPGYNENIQEPKFLIEQAKKIGFPIMIKAVMGGGGRGMRKVINEADFLSILNSAKEEATRLYSNSNICIEKFIEEPRHIEIQVAGDLEQNHIHFFERDCSVQRRFQKVVEYTPALIEEEILEKLYINALKIAKGSKLSSLATMEFLVSEKTKEIYFLEANPRIQVEHPVTEIACEVDLVELQIQIANSKKINNIKASKKNHALQIRIYAEAPEKNFISTSGTLKESNLPSIDDSFVLKQNSRYDHALYQGFELNQDFDPMLCKLLVKADDHENLKLRGLKELEKLQILGIDTNIPLLIELFKGEKLYTTNIQDLEKLDWNHKTKDIAALASFLLSYDTKSNLPFSKGWKTHKTETERLYYVSIPTIDKTQDKISIKQNSNLYLNDTKVEAELSLVISSKNFTQHNLRVNDKSYSIISKNFNSQFLLVNGRLHTVEKTKQLQLNIKEQSGKILSPLPGKVTKIHVKIGQSVAEGENLISIESMKIEHNIKCNLELSEIEEILVKIGENVVFEQELIKLKR